MGSNRFLGISIARNSFRSQVNSMSPVLQELLILQERDSKIQAAKKDLENIPLEAGKIKEKLNEKLKALNAAKDTYFDAQKAVKQVDLDRQTRKDTITKLKMRQGETKKNEEFQMLAHEIVRYSEQIDELETKELELMESVDLRKQERVEANDQLLAEKKFATEKGQELVELKKNSESVIKKMQSERDSLVQKVEVSARELYERLLASRGAGVVVLLKPEGQCTGCNMKLPPATIHRVTAGAELVQCSECSRILYNA